MDHAEVPETLHCVWCETELSPDDAKPIKYARNPDVSDAENMQCRDFKACQERQDALDAAQRARAGMAGES
jgi:hypothetical protein